MSGIILINPFIPEDVTALDPFHPGGDPQNCFDGNTYTSWKLAAGDIYGVFYFSTGEDILINALMVSGVSGLDDINNMFLYGADNPEMTDKAVIVGLNFTDISESRLVTSENLTEYRYFQITVATHTQNNDKLEISNVIAGEYHTLPNGIAAPYTPPKLSTKSEVTNNKTMGGHFVGRSVLTGQYDFIIKNKNLTPEWINANWQGIHDQILTKPFMYLWDDSKPEDAVFCWTKGDIPAPKYDNQCYFSFSIPCNGFIENV